LTSDAQVTIQKQQKNIYMKNQGNVSPPKVNNSQITDCNDSGVNEVLDKEFKIMIVRMINKIKEVTNIYLN
jgi:hypothetical protein